MSKKILIIEDEKSLGKMLATEISATGYEVKHVESAEEAKKASDFSADLLIIDHGLPGQQGIDAIPDFKEIFTKAKMVVFSNYNDTDHIEKAKKNGADDYWVKVNFRLDQVIEKINQILN